MLFALPLLLACSGSDAVTDVRGSLTWSVEFDSLAKGAGLSDCTYERRYDGHTDDSVPWLCPDCDAIYRAEVTFDGLDCYGQFAQSDPSSVEWLGFAGKEFRRASFENYALGEQGTVSGSDTLQVAYEGDWTGLDTGRYRLSVSGDLKTRTGKGDPMWGMTPPDRYACGWAKADPDPYEGDWSLQSGKLIPDGWFLDACDEPVRLHDQLGAWMIIGVSAMDCGPCQEMAVGEEAFIEEMATEGVEVRVVTLLAPTLDAIIEPATTDELKEWKRTFDLSMPILADRGWGYWLGSEATPDFGYPTLLIVDPEGRLVQIRTGFSDWDTLAEVIRG